MSTILTEPDGTTVRAEDALREIRARIDEARAHRKRYEPTWHSNLAFAAGKFWLAWDRDQRRLVFPPELQRKELYTADLITEYRTTALGELGTDDDRPELLLRREDEYSEAFQAQLNRVVSWAWDYEWQADEVLEEMRRLCVDLGTTAIRCRFDPSYGPIVQDNVPHVDGRPVLDPEEARSLLANGPNPAVTMRPIHQGRIVWEALSPLNLIVPPGIPHERYFPWEAVIRPVPLDQVRDEFGNVEGIKADGDIGSLLGFDVQAELADGTNVIGLRQDSDRGQLRDHVWLITYYERPSRRYPQGRTITFVGNTMKPLRVRNSLPYKLPNGSYHSGIVYFHWWRTSGRFWSRALVEAAKDPQRSFNKRRTQINEIIDRGLPAIFVEENSRAKDRRGLPNELIELKPQERAPTVFEGVRPGQWMYQELDQLRVDLEHATGIRGPRLGENPANVTTYAQLALLTENDFVKRQIIRREHQNGIARLVELSVLDMKRYWGERTIMFAGDDDQVEAEIFDANQIPDFFIVKVAKGSTKPRSQGAELKKIEELWNGAVASGAVALDPIAWIQWFRDSLEQGQALDMPAVGSTPHEEKARIENHKLLNGDEVFVQYYDRHELHIEIHREVQIQAELAGDVALWQRVEDHVQQHVAMQAQTANVLASALPGLGAPLPGLGAPPPEPGVPEGGVAPAPGGEAPGENGGGPEGEVLP